MGCVTCNSCGDCADGAITLGRRQPRQPVLARSTGAALPSRPLGAALAGGAPAPAPMPVMVPMVVVKAAS